jgi:hypothetical protein
VLELDYIKEVVNSIGFPIFVAVYFMTKNYKAQLKTNELLIKLGNAIDSMCNNCNRKEGE